MKIKQFSEGCQSTIPDQKRQSELYNNVEKHLLRVLHRILERQTKKQTDGETKESKQF